MPQEEIAADEVMIRPLWKGEGEVGGDDRPLPERGDLNAVPAFERVEQFGAKREVVAFDFFGHEVELLPRTLYLNKVEHPWKSGAVFTLQPNQKLPPEASVDPRAKKKRSFGR